MARSRQSLSHDVGQHQRSLTVLQLDITTLDFIAYVMVLNVNMLDTSMAHRILSHLDVRLVILHDLKLGSRSICGGIENLTQQAMYPIAVLSGQT